jgi:hypothetical protein
VNGFLVAGGVGATLLALGWCSRAIVATAFGAEIGRAALEDQPDEIHLEPAGEAPWKDGRPEALGFRIVQLGFADAGTWRVREMPVVVRLFAHPGEHFYACVYQHERIGCWFEITGVYRDGGSVTFTTARETGLDPHPDHPTFHAPGATPARLFGLAMAERPMRPFAAVSAAEAPRAFERAYAGQVAWLKRHGLSTHEVVRVALKKAA